jgi:hypothetical protein
MAEDSAKEQPLTLNELNAFVMAKVADGIRCPVCRTNQFHPVSNDADIYVNLYLAKKTENPSLVGNSVPAVGIFCDNCGNILMFHRNVILAWRDRST